MNKNLLRQCTFCGEHQPQSFFYSGKAWCKACYKKYYYPRNRERQQVKRGAGKASCQE